MKIAILSRKATLYSTSRLVEACRQRGADVTVLDPLQCVVKVSKKRPEVFHHGERVTGLDGVVPRIGASITFYGLAVLRQFEMMGVFPANESQAISRSRDKLRSLQLLSPPRHRHPAHRLRPPPRGRALGHPQGRRARRSSSSCSKGRRAWASFWPSRPNRPSRCSTPCSALEQNILIQAFIEEAHGDRLPRHRRRRQGGGGDGAPGRGGGVPQQPPPRRHRHRRRAPTEPTCRPAIHAAEVLGLNIAGVDMIPSKEGPMVLEVNSSPGLEGIEGATGVDVAGAMIDFVLERAHQGHPLTQGRG